MSLWLTCTPRDFAGNETFFARDCGLLSRGFQSIGVPCRAIQSGKPRDDDEPDLVRAAPSELESADWWKKWKADGVVLYAWGRPRYLGVARAIRKAGLYLVLNQDSGGVVSPLAGPLEWLEGRFSVSGGCRGPGAVATFLGGLARGLTIELFFTDPMRAWHFHQGDIISAVSPGAAEKYRKLCRIYGGRKLAAKVGMIPHPVSTIYRYAAEDPVKSDRVVAVGRWDDENQKRPRLLARAMEVALRERAGTEFHIFGHPGQTLPAWHERLDPRYRERVRLAGRQAPPRLAEVMRGARVFFSSSAYESGHIAAMEALCSGCGFVGCSGALLACNQWFAEEHCGTLAESPSRLADALLRELDAWDAWRRDPVGIARRWNEMVHAPNVARRILEFAGNRQRHGHA